jgi:hypothetical protein
MPVSDGTRHEWASNVASGRDGRVRMQNNQEIAVLTRVNELMGIRGLKAYEVLVRLERQKDECYVLSFVSAGPMSAWREQRWAEILSALGIEDGDPPALRGSIRDISDALDNA